MRLPSPLLALAGVLVIITANLSIAQEQTAVQQQPATSSSPVTSLEHPARGLTMEKVEAKFGAPSQKVESVGKPPITRWEYPGYTVYFEHEYVLHTVVAK